MHFLEGKYHLKRADLPFHQRMIQAFRITRNKVKVKIGNGQEMVQSERNSHSKNRGGTESEPHPQLRQCKTFSELFGPL